MRRFFYGSVDIFEIDEFVILCIVSVLIVTNGIQNILCLLNIHEQDNNTYRRFRRNEERKPESVLCMSSIGVDTVA
jgi:hypothetical protein